MNIRKALPSDEKIWIEMNREFIAYELTDDNNSVFWNKVELTDDKTYSQTFRTALTETDNIKIFIMEDEEGNAIGFTHLLSIFNVWAQGWALIIDDLFIRAAYRHEGHGTDFLKFIEKYAQENKFKRIQFHVRLTNPEALEFCSNYGFNSEQMGFYTKFY